MSPEPTVSYRNATLNDAQTIVHFLLEMAKESENVKLDQPTVERAVEIVLQTPSKGEYFVAEMEGELVGQLMVTYEFSDWRAKDAWWIQSVYVSTAARRRGVYRGLYQHVKQLAVSAGACGLRLYADKDNAKALETYEKLGMTSHYLVYEDMFTQI